MKNKGQRVIHGESGTRLYTLWKGMKARCYNFNHASYKNYGGRGIKVCEEWRNNYLTFRDFFLNLGYDETLPTGQQTIERIDTNKNYEPSNCILISRAQQNLNKRNNHVVTYRGVTKTVTEFSNALGLDVETVLNRINNYGYSIEEALEIPVRKCPHKNAPKYEVDGESLTMREWAEKFGMTRSQLKSKARHKPVDEVIKELKIKLYG